MGWSGNEGVAVSHPLDFCWIWGHSTHCPLISKLGFLPCPKGPLGLIPLIPTCSSPPGKQAENQNPAEHPEPHVERDPHLLRHHRRGHDPQDAAVGPRPGGKNGSLPPPSTLPAAPPHPSDNFTPGPPCSAPGSCSEQGRVLLCASIPFLLQHHPHNSLPAQLPCFGFNLFMPSSHRLTLSL